MSKLTISKIGIILAVVMAIVVLSCTSCTKTNRLNIVNASVQGVNITYNDNYGYESKIYAINNTSTTLINIKARRLYYIQGTNVYTDTIISQDIHLSNGYYNGLFITANGDKINIINVKNEKP